MAENNKNLFWRQFLEIYQAHPALWQIKMNHCADAREKGISLLIEKMKEVNPEANRVTVLKKINIFKAAYKKEARKVKNRMRSASSKDHLYRPKLWYYEQMKFLDETDGNAIGVTSIENDMSFDRTQKKKNNDGNLPGDKLLAAASKLQQRDEESGENSLDEEEDHMFKWWYLKFKKIPAGVQRELVTKVYLDIAIHCSQGGSINMLQVKQIQDILYASSVATDNASNILGEEK